MDDINLDVNTIKEIQESKKEILYIERNIIKLVTGFCNAKGKDVSNYQFDKTFTKLELVNKKK
mgnify:CR=1 FL=1|jgi:hypothetical protein